VIVDDVVTTGASVDAAVYACHQAGLRVAGVIAIATALPHPDIGLNAVPGTPVIPQNVSP
jgi:orotate phosphoribosyltransferase-like protein